MNDKPSILLVNPPIYDFAAFDFWLKPLGMLSAAGKIENGDSHIFDFLDRNHEFYRDKPESKNDKWGRGKFYSAIIQKPDALKDIPRYFQRFGLPAEFFVEFLKTQTPRDLVFVQTVMTYWYSGYREIIETIRKHWPKSKIILGGPYTKICPQHAKSLGADFVFDDGTSDPAPDGISETASHGANSVLAGLARTPTTGVGAKQLPRWELYEKLTTAAMKITQGCPYKCTYCAVPMFGENFSIKPLKQAIEELNFLVSLGVKNIAFYDDALLYKSDDCLKPFLRYVIENKIKVNFHTPNALNARFIDEENAMLMVKAGFKSFYLGFESQSEEFQKKTGAKISKEEFSKAVKFLIAAGAEKNGVIAYMVFGHPAFEIQDIEESMRFVNNLGIKIMLAEFSPIPGTPDGKLCEKYIDMSEPLTHNKTAFVITLLGKEKVDRIKDMSHKLNHNI